MFKNPFSFTGRIRRLEYGLTYLFYFVFRVILEIAVVASEAFSMLYLLSLPLVWILIAQGTKRCHDLNRSGWWQLIPFYGFVMLFSEGDHGRNEYGPDPKHTDYEEMIEEIGESAPYDWSYGTSQQ